MRMRHIGLCLLAVCLTPAFATPQGEDTSTPDPLRLAEPLKAAPKDDAHILGIVPDYDTVRNSSGVISPISARTKWWLATEDNFDPFSFVLTGIYAGVYQAVHEYPEFGYGAKGYAKRYGGALADGVVGNYMTEALLPVVLHQDPRLFRMGPSGGGFWKRAGYAASRVLVTRSDSGSTQFNLSEIGGNAAASAIAGLYYPVSGRRAEDFFDRWAVSVASDAGFNVLREFWPDMRHKFFRK